VQVGLQQIVNRSNSPYYIINYFKGKEEYMKRLLMIGFGLVFGTASVCVAQENNDTLHRYFHLNGRVASEGRLVNGKPEGHWRTYSEDGVLRSEGDRRDLLLEGVWKFYDPQGRLASSITYMDDKKNGPSFRYDSVGVVMSEELYVDDLREGVAKYYHHNGELHKEIPFQSGKEEGRGTEFAPDGRIVALLQYGAGLLRKREDINQLDELGLRQGPWKEFHTNGKVKWEGVYVDDQRQGLFKEYDAQGGLKDLVKYDAGRVDELAQQTQMLDIKKNYHPNGKVASMGSYSRTGTKEGLFREYDTKGESVRASIYVADQLISQGAVNDVGALEGPWTEFYLTGEKRAEGSYKAGRKEGEWSFFHRDGRIEQKGKYQNGLPQGTWEWFYEGGMKHREELYRKGKEDGASVEYDEEGGVIVQGEYIDGLKEGKWFYKVGDHQEEGAYKDGLKDGPWVHIYDNGRKSFTGSFVNGDPDGKHKWYYYNGQIKLEGRYNIGLEQGDFIHYNEQGFPITVVKFRDGAEIRIDGERIPPPYQLDGTLP
jgi:antitoxin component YwqK of YwqJK toxin-antitoxin module